MLNAYFGSVCTEDDLRPISHTVCTDYNGPVIEDATISVDLVKLKLCQLKTSSAAGPDGLHPRVLHETRDSVSTQLAAIYRETLDTGILPEDWALADVVPIYKKGSKDDPNNYRPISLTSIPCNVLESIIRDQLMEHLQSENLLADAQHGFRPGRSCATQLLLAVEKWSRSVEHRVLGLFGS